MRRRSITIIGSVMALLMLSMIPTYADTSCNLNGDIERISGVDRYETSGNLARNCFAGASTVVIATGENFADALSGSTLAAAVGGPVLLTRSAGLPSSTATVLDALRPSKAYILGGTGAVSENVEREIYLKGIAIIRISGTDRYETSAEIALEVRKIVNFIKDDTAIIATGENFPDALSASSFAADQGYPILLVKKFSVPAKVNASLKDLGISNAFVIGGTGVITDQTADDLYPDHWKRLWGSNRYDTSQAVYDLSLNQFGMSETVVYVASGTNFPDALVAGPVAAMEDRAPIILSNTGPSPDPSVADFWEDNGDPLEKVVIVGGFSAINQDMQDLFEDSLDGELENSENSGNSEGDLHVTLDSTLKDDLVDLSAVVVDDEGKGVSSASVTLTIRVRPSGSGNFGGDVCSSYLNDCEKDTNGDGEADFNNISIADLEFGDVIQFSVTSEKDEYDSASASASIP